MSRVAVRHKILAVTFALAALLVAGCGGSDHKSKGKGHSSSGASGAGVDRAFVAGMIPHHESALEMAQIAEGRAESPFVKQLAADITRTQQAEITRMKAADARLAEAGVKKGDLGVDHADMGMDGDTASLETADPFDEAFIAMMLPHHEGAVKMAQIQIEKGTDPELKEIAADIIKGQEREIRAMRAHQS